MCKGRQALTGKEGQGAPWQAHPFPTCICVCACICICVCRVRQVLTGKGQGAPWQLTNLCLCLCLYLYLCLCLCLYLYLQGQEALTGKQGATSYLASSPLSKPVFVIVIVFVFFIVIVSVFVFVFTRAAGQALTGKEGQGAGSPLSKPIWSQTPSDGYSPLLSKCYAVQAFRLKGATFVYATC